MQDLGYELPRISIPRTRVNKGKGKGCVWLFRVLSQRIYLEGKPSKAGLPAAPHQVFGPALRYRRKGSEEASDALEAAVGCQLHKVHALQ
jgi:hypothetical protein